MNEQELMTAPEAVEGPDYSLEVDLTPDVIKAGVYGSMPRFYNLLYPLMILFVGFMAGRDIAEYGFTLAFEGLYLIVILVIAYVWIFAPKRITQRRVAMIRAACGSDTLHQSWLFWPQGIQITDTRVGHEVHFRYDTVTRFTRYRDCYVLRIRPRQMAVIPAAPIDSTPGMLQYLQEKCANAKFNIKEK